MNRISVIADMPGRAEYSYAHPFATCSHAYVLPRIQSLLSRRGCGTRVLDLGCGNGSLLGAISNSEWELHGVDSSCSGIDIARQAHPGIGFGIGDITGRFGDLGCPVNYFDVVLSTEVIEHVYAPRKLVENAFEALRPGGQLILTTPYHGYLKNLALALTGKFDAHFTALWDGGHIKFWSHQTLTILLREARLTEIKFYGTGRCPFLWKSTVVSAWKSGTA
jgi:2-polyprenyl-3-methyl-5-hydroxy-6-metoxy-1,4-benzoquinol methylase